MNEDIQWRRVHKATPLIKSWQVLAAMALAAVFYGAEDFFTNIGEFYFPPGGVFLIFGGLVLVAMAVAVGYSYLAWRKIAYAISADAVLYHHGIFFRSQRHARLNRIQGVDITRPLLGRLVGLSSLTIESAGGADSKVTIEYLKDEEAQRLRAEILARAAGLSAVVAPANVAGADVPRAPDAPPVFALAPERVVHELSSDHLIRSLLYSGWLWLGVGTGMAVLAILLVLGQGWALVMLIPGFLVPLLIGWQYFTAFFGSTFAISPDGLRLRRGLLTTTSQTIPPGRIQAVRLSQPLLWRRRDWWRLEMDVAGYGAQKSSNNGESTQNLAQNMVLPVAPREVALHALWIIYRDLGVENPDAALAAGLTGMGADGGFEHSPRSARWVDPISWQRNGLLITSTVMLMRSGRITRRLAVVPHERTQSLAVARGPLQRRLRVATFHAHSVPGPVKAKAKHLPEQTATRILMDQAERARRARAKEGPEEWMRRVSSPSETIEP